MMHTPASHKKEQIQSILSRVERLSASYGLHPFRLMLIRPGKSNHHTSAIHKLTKSTHVQSDALLLVLGIRSVFNKESFDTFITEPGINRNISRSHLTSYRINIQKSIKGRDRDGKRWAARQADLALQIITSTAKELSLEAVVLKNEIALSFDHTLSLEEKGLEPYAVVAIR